MNDQQKSPMRGITLLGLGPGEAKYLTREAWQILEDSTEIYLRTNRHPVVAAFPTGLHIHSFDHLYENAAQFEAVYAQIVERVLELGGRPEGVVYAVPGHPFVAESTSPEIARRAGESGIPVRVVEGLSFLEPVFSVLGVDPFPRLVLIDALEIASKHTPTFQPDAPAIIAQIYSREVASEVKLTLMSVYPDDHPVTLIHAAGTAEAVVENIKLFEIDRSPHIELLSALYLPPLAEETSFEAFQEVIARLRAPDGCPWDREQTHQTLRAHLLEETYEVLNALDIEDTHALCEELGDLLLQIVLNAQIAAEDGEFRMADVLQGINMKLVHRHPHVFGELKVKDVDGVLLNWELLKADERAANGKAEAGLMDSVPLALPALNQAEQYQRRVARVGFDWKDIEGVRAKLDEELIEVQQATTPQEIADEIGDLLFSVVNLARWLDVDAESALRATNQRFRHRFAQIEASARERGISVADLSLDEMEAIWQAAKRSADQ